jgi:hypothetical protein
MRHVKSQILVWCEYSKLNMELSQSVESPPKDPLVVTNAPKLVFRCLFPIVKTSTSSKLFSWRRGTKVFDKQIRSLNTYSLNLLPKPLQF